MGQRHGTALSGRAPRAIFSATGVNRAVHLATILATGELARCATHARASLVCMMAGDVRTAKQSLEWMLLMHPVA